jgi:SAM-dependent methyltransferase
MSFGERILLLLSRPLGPDLPGGVEEWNERNALDLIRHEVPGFDRLIAAGSIVDFGCGNGWQSLAMAQDGARSVLGVDANPGCIRYAQALAASRQPTAAQLDFAIALPPASAESFDVVISQNSFEHFGDPAKTLEEMTRALRPGGRLIITFGPPWLAPFGAHMFFFTSLPWVHLLFSEATVLRARAHFRSDRARRYEDVEGGLNRMTLRRFERLVNEAGLRVEWSRYGCVKGWTWLGRIWGIREFFVNVVNCVLVKDPAPARSSTPRALDVAGVAT